MIHSILPYEMIFAPQVQTAESGRICDIPIRHGHISTLIDAAGHAKIRSLFSTDPYDYLNPVYKPGNPWMR